MSQVINTNVASLNSQRQLNKSQSSLNQALERLSSGMRINSAKDDAAGLAISDRMTAQINGMDQAVRNANDGISLAQTAESALGSITDNLQRIRELAVQAANATNSASDRTSIQAEVTQLSNEITRVASQTQFNGINLLDGTFSNQAFQVGANANQTISITAVTNSKATALGAQQLTAGGTAMGAIVSSTAGSIANGVVAETDLTLTTSAGTTASITYGLSAGADAIAAAINASASSKGVTATATNSVDIQTLNANGNLTFALKGGTGTANITANGVTTSDFTNLVSAINAQTTTTGVTASFTTSGTANVITLSTADGSNIELADFANSNGTGTISFGGTTLTEAATDSAVKTGTLKLSSTQGTISTATANADVFTTAGINTSSLSAVSAISVTTAQGAQDAIAVVDAALSTIDSARGQLGAVQNRFTSVVSNLQSNSENASASRSRIQDADFAVETSNMSKANILQQAGTAMLAQANQTAQNVLSLLK